MEMYSILTAMTITRPKILQTAVGTPWWYTHFVFHLAL